MKKKAFFSIAVLAVFVCGQMAAAWDGLGIYVSPWAQEQVRAAYMSGAVSESFDLGSDYTRSITRGELARLTVDLVAHEWQISVSDMAAQLDISLQAVPLTPAQPDGQTGESETDSEVNVPDVGVPEDEETLDEEGAAPEPSPGEEVLEEEQLPTEGEYPDGEETPEEEPLPETDLPAEESAPWGDPLDGGLPFVASGSFADTESVYIEIAARLGIVSGSDGLFRPDDPVTRAEAAAMMERCMGVLGFPEANRAPQQFSDHYQIPRWAVTSVKYISGRTDGNGQAIMSGWDGGFHPADTYTVEQAILSLQRMQASLAVNEVYEGWRDAPGYQSVQLALTFGGDCTLGRNEGAAYSGSFDEMYDLQGPAYFFSGISEFFDDDLTMINFEGTLTNATTSMDKTFVFKGRPEYVEVLKAGSIDVVTLANNHSKDYLQRGYDDTVQYLSPDIAVSAYEQMPIITVKGVRIGFASNVGWLFDTAQKNFITNAIEDLRARGADIIIFNYHWGVEKTYQSNQVQRAIGRYCIDQGADLVIGHHPHVVQEVEIYQGKPIVYSLGNLVFGGNRNPSDKDCLIFRQNYIVDLDTRAILDASYEAIPYKVSSVAWRNDYHPSKDTNN